MDTATRADLGLPAIKDKPLLTLNEAVLYFNIGESKLKDLTNKKDCGFVLFNGNRRLIKREKMEEFLENSFSI